MRSVGIPSTKPFLRRALLLVKGAWHDHGRDRGAYSKSAQRMGNSAMESENPKHGARPIEVVKGYGASEYRYERQLFLELTAHKASAWLGWNLPTCSSEQAHPAAYTRR
ncbi:hypothetical protein MY3296_000255 [Beauveria thailandica]